MGKIFELEISDAKNIRRLSSDMQANLLLLINRDVGIDRVGREKGQAVLHKRI